MAVTDQQKLDFLLKKIGYTKTKTGNVDGTGNPGEGSVKQPFAEAIPSPLVVPNSSLWNEADSIPATPPGSDTTQVKVYSASSAVRLTEDITVSTASQARSWIAYSTYNNTSSARLTNWIDTQFGAGYLIKVYNGDPNSGGTPLSAGATNQNWFFDYSAGVLNFNDDTCPVSPSDSIYIVGYRYIGQTGAPTSGISTFSFLDLSVERNLDVGVQGGISTFRNNIDANGIIEGIAGENKIPSLYANLAALPSASTYHGMFAHVHSTGRGYFAHAGNWLELVNKDTSGNVGLSGDFDVDGHTNLDNISVSGVSTFTGDATFSGNVSIGGTLTYEDVTNVDSVGLLTARSGIRVTGGVIEAQAGENKIPSLYANYSNLPNAGSYHGMFAHVHATGRGYFAHAGNWLELVNADTTGRVGTGTESYFIDRLVSTSTTATSLNVTGVTTAVTVDINGDLDVDGHTNLDNLSVAGVSTFADRVTISGGKDLFMFDNGVIRLGDNSNTSDFQMFHNGHTRLNNASGSLFIENTSTNGFVSISAKSGQTGILVREAPVRLFYDNTLRFSTSGVGATVYGNLDVTADLDVDGHTNLDNVSIAGVTSITQDLDVDGHTNLDNVSIAGVTTFTGAIDANGDLDVAGDLDVDGHTNLDNVNIVGVTTAAGHVLPFSDVTYDLGSSSKQWRNLYADNIVSAPGNGFIGPDLTVRNFKTTGISTFGGNARFNSTIAVHDGTTGSNGQYLKSIGTGVTWATFPTLRTRDTIVASAGQTFFSFNYTVNFIDVFVNGIKLTDSEFTATNGTSVTLAVGCFVGDIVELVSYNTVSSGGGGGGGTLNNIVEDTSPQLGGNLDLFGKTINGTGGINITGVVTATTFIGDGSGLTGITASGTGVVIRNNDSTVGTAGTINFGDDLSVTPIVAGIVTVGIDTSQINLNKLNVSGISTFNGNIDVNADLDVDGHTNLDNVSVAGVVTATTFVGAVTGNVTGNATGLSGTPNISVGTISGSTGTFSGTIDANGDLDVDGHTELDNVNIAGVVTATTFKGAVQATSGTFSSGVDITGDLDVDGHTDLDNVSIAGVVTATTFSGSGASLTNLPAGNLTGVLPAISGANLTNLPSQLSTSNMSDNRVVTSSGGVVFNGEANLTFDGSTLNVGTGVTIETNGQATYTGIVTAQKFVGDGSSLTNVSAAGINTTNLRADTLVVGENTTGVSTFHRVNIPTNKNFYFGDSNQASISYTNSNYLYVNGGIEGDMVIQTGGNRSIKMEASGNFEIDTGSNEIAIKATKNGPVELYQNAYGGSEGLRFATTGVGVTVIGITSMTDNLLVGTAATITPAGAAQFAGIVTASSFIGDGSGLTGITASGSGVVVKDSGSTVGTAGTINFANGLDVTPISAGIVTVSTATTSISVGTSKAFINNNSSASGDGSFEIFLSDSTYSGVGRTAFRLHSPAANSNAVEFFGENTTLYNSLSLKAIYGGNTSQSILFNTNNANFQGRITNSTAGGSFNFYSKYNGTDYNPLQIGLNQMYAVSFYPKTDNAYDLGYQGTGGGAQNFRWRQIHANNLNVVGLTTVTDVHVGYGVSAVGIVTADQGVRVNADSANPAGNSATNYISVGESQDLKLYHNGNQSRITAADGDLLIQADNIMLVSDDTSGRSLYQDNANSRLELGFDGTAAAYVSSSNVQFAKPITASADSTHDIGTNSVRFRNAYVDTYYGDGSNLTGISAGTPTTSDIQVVYEITNQTSFSYFRFAGNGVDSSANNPDIYLERGQKYRFINNSGGSHPFQIQTTASSAYTTGVTYPSGNSASSGNIDFAVRWDAPSQLKYVCTSHGAMVGNIYISGGEAGRRTTANAATSSIANNAAGNITIVAAKTYALLKIQTSAAAWVTLYTDSTSRSNDSSRNETTDPTPGSGVIAEVITTGASTQIMTPGIIGWNNDGTVSSNVYAKVVNKSGSTGAITVTLHYLEMEI